MKKGNPLPLQDIFPKPSNVRLNENEIELQSVPVVFEAKMANHCNDSMQA